MKVLGTKLLAALFALGLAPGLAAADSTFHNSLDEASCDDSNQCVIFEVSVQLDTVATVPVAQESSNIMVINGTPNRYGTSVQRADDRCTKQVKVPREVFRAIVGIMKSLSGEEGEPAPAFTPAQQTILLFYTTLMQQTLQFQCTPREMGGGSGGTK